MGFNFDNGDISSPGNYNVANKNPLVPIIKFINPLFRKSNILKNPYYR